MQPVSVAKNVWFVIHCSAGQGNGRLALCDALALALVSVRALDRIVVGGTATVSFAERGWV